MIAYAPSSAGFFSRARGVNKSLAWMLVFMSVLALAPRAQTIVSDDFNGPLNTNVWTFIDPVGDATQTMTGTQALISIPASNQNHAIWYEGLRSPRLMQRAGNGDFEIEIKFDSPQSQVYQFQGILVEADSQNFLRMEFMYDGSQYGNSLYVLSVANNNFNPITWDPIIVTGGGYLRVARSSDTWTVSYSSNGTQWTVGSTFSMALNVTSVGFYCGNFDPNPAHTTLVDYFHNNSAGPSAPSITNQPGNQIVNEGLPATFSVTASGSGNLSYQWKRNGQDIPGASNANYAIPATSAADDSAAFLCVVSNSAGSISSTAAILTIFRKPVILTQPTSQSVAIGQLTTFSVSASGGGPLSYQWLRGGLAIANATQATYTAPAAISGDDQAKFSVQVTNSAGSVTSAEATLIVNSPPVVTVQPAAMTVNAGQPTTFSVTVTGVTPFTYQWMRNGSTIAGANAAVYVLNPSTATDSGVGFSVTVSNPGGSVNSAIAGLTVITPPTILTSPADRSVTVSSPTSFVVTVGGSAPFAYQWRRDGVDIPGATGATYSIPSTVPGDNGKRFSVHVSNPAGSLTSQDAVLNLVQPLAAPSFTLQPVSLTVVRGQAAVFHAAVTGNPSPALKWKRDGVDITGDTGSDLILPAVARDDSGKQFTVVATNSQGTLTSAVAILTVTPLPNSSLYALSGELFTPAGVPIGQGSPVQRDFTVKLYPVEQGGTALYTETFLAANGQSVPVSEGLFSVKLGSGTSSDDLNTVVAGNRSLYAELQVGTPAVGLETIQPRMAVTSPLLSGIPSMLEGSGVPVASEPVGTYYQNSSDGSLWLRTKTSWVKIGQ